MDNAKAIPPASLGGAAALPAQGSDGVLGALCYSLDAKDACPPHWAPCLHVPLTRLDADTAVRELWRATAPTAQGRRGALCYRHDGDLLFGAIALAEADFAGAAGHTPLQQATEAGYREVFALLDALGYPHLIRCWNYFPQINAHSFGLERYWQFNLGRQTAFAENGVNTQRGIPAASALGTSCGPLGIAFIAGRAAPLAIENPRQVSAYHYPPQYGPRSPMFARASVARLPQQTMLFVSGTASIVGHRTLYAGDVGAQVRETLANIREVLAETQRRAGDLRFELHDLRYRVYVRHPAHYAQIRAELQAGVGETPKAVYLQADVCRSDLLVEIEASAGGLCADAADGRG